VRLPNGWKAKDGKTWPVLYYASGFGGGATEGLQLVANFEEAVDRMILVSPSATNHYGHSVFADSDNTGPWGKMLTDELIPYIDATYGGAGASKRYLTGISSGGWSTIWLQVNYPDVFAESWAHVPDPVDFRDFQRVNMYRAGDNMFTEADGSPRPVARSEGEPILFYKPFVNMETALGAGGQIHSFEAVFSAKGKNGKPVPVFDRTTGAVDTAATKAWERYDIARIMKANWSTLGPKLDKKLHVYIGGADTFYLDGAGRLLQADLKALGSTMDFQVIDGMAHQFAPGKLGDMFKTITGVSQEAAAAE
jgi:hypothetical protein